MSRWRWIAATCRGLSHERHDLRLQDALACFTAGQSENFLTAIVCDGAGSAKFGGQGASLVCRRFSLLARNHLRIKNDFPTDDDITDWLDEIRDLIGLVANQRNCTPRDFASTLIFMISNGAETFVGHIGDGAIVTRQKETNEWHALSWPENGEYASTTFFVTDEPEAKLRLTRYPAPITAAALLTDGLERLALDFAIQQPFSPFFDAMIAPIDQGCIDGKDQALSKKLKQYLGSPAVTARTDDDKSLILTTFK